MNNSTKTKAIVIGLDGADWRLLRPLINSGKLPTLNRLIQEGCHGPLRSTIRPESSAAWSSFATGVWPGEHGVYSFLRHEEDSYNFKLANSSTIGAPRFWKILGDAGYKVGLVNIPFTYPPQQVNGFMVGGMLTPGVDVTFTHPPDLQGRILSRFPNYRQDAADDLDERDALIESADAFTAQQMELALFLMREEEWDLFTIVFTALDRLQHYFWRDMDRHHPAHDSEDALHYGRAIETHLAQLDAAIGLLLADSPENTLVLVMSDHGFNGCANRFFVNRWLEENGYLVTRKQSKRQASVVEKISNLKSVPLLRRVKRALLPADWGPASLRISRLAQSIDWSRTRAYFAPDGGIRINLKGREPEGIVEPGQPLESIKAELKRELLSIESDWENQPPLGQVYLSEELYRGRYAKNAADLILEPQRECLQSAGNFILDGSTDSSKGIFGSAEPYSGNHALDGILIATGPGVNGSSEIDGATIVDLAPTLLASFDVPIPDRMEGEVLIDLFSPGYLAGSRSESSGDEEGPQGEGDEFDEQEENIVEARLRNLGYLD